jgi:Protein of unknown function (DUF975).
MFSDLKKEARELLYSQKNKIFLMSIPLSLLFFITEVYKQVNHMNNLGAVDDNNLFINLSYIIIGLLQIYLIFVIVAALSNKKISEYKQNFIDNGTDFIISFVIFSIIATILVFTFVAIVFLNSIISLGVGLLPYFWLSTIVIILLYVIATILFSQVIYIIIYAFLGKIDMKYLNIFKAFQLSYLIMKKNIIQYIIFLFSFIGWLLLILFTLGLAIFYVLPYLNIAYVLYFEKVATEYGLEIK